ncbi:hypothetical protein [Bacillus sp. 165]|uniref:hypothetical protein n=1 Tax=Bacillus sp. 165 TaxID=1529117 RepID=UPI001ADC2986|nr:hypothetical protein [Bacillus sp. 165]MBO9129551.1 hypothetical protein [Bacillus sp. 165]
MKQYLELGACIAALVGIISVLLQDWYVVYQFSGVIGIAAILLGCVAFMITKRNSQSRRREYAIGLFMISIPNLLAAALYLVFQ